MNLGQHQRLSQAQGLSMNNIPYGEVRSPSTRSSLPLQPIDGLAQAQPDQRFVASVSSTMNVLPTYSLIDPTAMAMPQSNMWDDALQMTPNFEIQNTNSFHGDFLGFPGSDFEVPRFIPNNMSRNDFNDDRTIDHESSGYITDNPHKSTHHLRSTDRSNLAYNPPNNGCELARLRISHSPLLKYENDDVFSDFLPFESVPTSRLPCSETEEDCGLSSREMTVVDEDPVVEEPYARLIHRALMSAPDHSMVLQEIYQWFRENTTKGRSDSKGWMNSIRHNLSMNAAFKKTERKVAGDETKKSTEWVLEDFAIRDGVQSTTRYRKGTIAKKLTRNHHPATARQVSGRKGGHAANANKHRFFRGLGKEDSKDSRRSTHTIDNGRRREFQDHMEMARLPVHRYQSPVTPPSLERLTPHILESPYDPDNYTLGEIQGVYIDGPLFDNNPTHDTSHFHGGVALFTQRLG